MKRLDKSVLIVGALFVLTCDGALAQTPTAPQVTGQVMLPHDLSPWGMFLGADMVVKSVLVGLALASLVTWTIALVKVFEVRAASRQAIAATRRLKASATLADAHASLDGQRGVIAAMLAAAADEVARSGPQLGADGIKERIAIALSRLEQAESRRLSRGTGVLATIGAIGPFVGLFGTVWGIMNSFIGISKAHTTNLAVVAPGIAEALLATAVGLAAAIPAVVVYNVFGRMTAAHKARVGDAASEIMRTVGRDLDRQAAFERDGTVRFAPAQAAE